MSWFNREKSKLVYALLDKDNKIRLIIDKGEVDSAVLPNLKTLYTTYQEHTAYEIQQGGHSDYGGMVVNFLVGDKLVLLNRNEMSS